MAPGWESVRRLNVGGGSCSGVFLDEQHLLTAAHCLREKGEPDLLPPEVVLEPEGELASAIFIHQDYGSGLSGNPDYDHDVAIVRFRGLQGRIFAPLSPFEVRRGELVSMVGYGRADEDDSASGGILRVGSNVVSGRDGNHILVTTRGRDPGPCRAILGSGDSGGPWFNDRGEVVGISSLGTMKSSSAVAVQTSGIRAFIARTISATSQNH